MSLLYVEDNPSDILLLKSALRIIDFSPRFHVATDGMFALEWLAARKCSGEPLPRLILLDLNLPRKNGYEVLDALKSDTSFREIPVIIFTGSANPEDKIRSLESQADDYWSKPKNLDEAVNIATRLKERMLQQQLIS
jgi:two-component system, chemotaxis family, response regulator Rcp1